MNDPTISESKDKFALKTLFADMEREKISKELSLPYKRLRMISRRMVNTKPKKVRLLQSLDVILTWNMPGQSRQKLLSYKRM